MFSSGLRNALPRERWNGEFFTDESIPGRHFVDECWAPGRRNRYPSGDEQSKTYAKRQAGSCPDTGDAFLAAIRAVTAVTLAAVTRFYAFPSQT